MKKHVSNITLKDYYNAKGKGTKYGYAGEWYNGGDFAELIRKAQLGLTPTIDRELKFNEGSDIAEYSESVKSSRASLTDVVLGSDFETIIKRFFKEVASKRFAWVTWDSDVVTTYIMSPTEFEEFARNFANYEPSGQRIRFRPTTRKMVRWLEERAI